MTTALHAEAERSPWVSTQNFVPTPSPIRPPVRRIWASLPLASSPQVWTPLTALRFRSVRYCIIRLLPDAPSREVRSYERPCLVDGGFPPSGPQEDLTATCLTSLFCVHAKHTSGSQGKLPSPSSQNRTCGPHIRLFGTSGSAHSSACSDVGMTARSYSSASVSWAGVMTRCISRYRCSSEKSPWSAKYRLSRA